MMRIFKINIFLLSLIVLFGGILIFPKSSTIDNLLYKGNNYYQKKEYDKAISTYQTILNQGYEGVSVYYNLGNSFYRENKLGYAIFYYEKALRLSPGDEDVIHNLLIANSKTVDKIDSIPQFFLVQWWNGLLALFTLSGWKNLAYLFYWIFLVSVSVYFFVRRTKYQKYTFYSAGLSLMLLIFTITLLLIKFDQEYSTKKGIIVEPIVDVKLSPDPNANDAFIIHEGLKVKVEDKVDNWYKIQLNDGKVGWLQQKEVGVI
ncbi:MAG TPA: tetratricopeptide repeat protein [Ignavibacteriaceae bacterium]|nr:tetratricopeptide repeat protein [Ignavibacteriaceae bacterium]